MSRGDRGVEFIIRVRVDPGANAIRSLRWVLKSLFRRYRLRCIAIEEIPPGTENTDVSDKRNLRQERE